MPSYKSDRGTWYCSFYYTDWQGQRKKKKKEGFKTKRAAQDWERKFLEQYATTPTISFDSVVSAYLKDASVRLKPTTFSVKKSIIIAKILPYFSGMTLNKITRRTVNDWRVNLLDTDCKPSYVKTIIAQLSAIFNYATDNYDLPCNPSLSNFRIKAISPQNVGYWTINEFRRFAMTLSTPQHIMGFYLLFWTGLRIGEMLALTWDDINLKNKAIFINKTRSRLKKQNITTTPKTINGVRVVIIPDFIVDMLRDYRHMSKYAGNNLFDITRGAFLKMIHAGAARAGVKQIRLHDLRHSHASMLIDAGFSPVDVADRLGHANPAITLKVYSHFYQAKRTQLAQRLNDLK